jgi:RNA polymerase sigma-70 factor (ECF subfamily)
MQSLTQKHQAILPAEGLAPDEQADRSDTEQWIPKLISALPKRQQEVIRLKFQQNLSYREIAEVLSISEGNVGFILHTGVKALRDHMQLVQGASL